MRSISWLSDGPDQLRKNVRESFRRGARFIKLAVSGGVVSTHDHLSDIQFTTEEIAVAVAEAKARGTYVTVHAHNNQSIRNAVTAGAACIEHGSQIDEATAETLAARDVAHVPTFTVLEALLADPAAAGLPPGIAARAALIRRGQINAIAAARAAGVRIGLGTDLIGPGQRERGRELVLPAGVETPMDALVSATKINAGIIGLGHDLGTLEEGKIADIIAFQGSPLARPGLFVDGVVLVIQQGRIVKDARS